MSESAQLPAVIRFGVFELDAAAGELRRSGRLVPLTGQPMRVLLRLVSRAGELVTRDELQREIWGGETHVDFDAGLSTCINQIRSALGDRAASPRFVETLPRRGYRFIAPVNSGSREPGAGNRMVSGHRISAGVALALAATVIVIVASLGTRAPAAPIPIVVVPVEIDSTRTDLGPVSLALTDALIGTLAAEAGSRARVASPLAVKHLRGRDVTLADISNVGAEYFVHVALRSLGAPVLVHAKLAHISGWILWTSEQELTIDQLERQLLSIAGGLAQRVTSEILPATSTSGRRAPKPEAVGDYAQAKADLENGLVAVSLSGFTKANRADALHPGTLAGLAQATFESAFGVPIDPRQAFADADTTARRALALDPDNARALAVLGAVSWLRDSRDDKARELLARALAIDGSIVFARQWQDRLRGRSRSAAN